MKKSSLFLTLSAFGTLSGCNDLKGSKNPSEKQAGAQDTHDPVEASPPVPTVDQSTQSPSADQTPSKNAITAAVPPGSAGVIEAAGDAVPKSSESIASAPALKLEEGTLEIEWIHGARRCSLDSNPPLQVHVYNKNLLILRENKCLNFEAPFLYLIFGEEKALLLDTGASSSASSFPVGRTVEGLVNEHYGLENRSKIQLVVAHTHSHGDHRSGDLQFKGALGTSLIATNQAAVASFFKITDWPNQIVDFNLGARILKVIPIPGHEESHIGIYDAQTGILFSGDTLYPGRLYIDDWDAYRASIHRLQTFLEDKAVSHILGAHIEMSLTPGKDFAAGSTFQPLEHALQLSRESLQLLDSELTKLGSIPQSEGLDDFIISP